MASALSLATESPSPRRENFFEHDSDDDATSQRSIPLSSPTTSTRPSEFDQNNTVKIQASHSIDSSRSYAQFDELPTSKDAITEPTSALQEQTTVSQTSFANTRRPGSESSSILTPSSSGETKFSEVKYPPRPLRMDSDSASMASFSSSSSRKARPESKLMDPPDGPLIPGIALVDFNHLVGPRIEFCEGTLFEDEQVMSIMPFLALPDGAHLSSEDYSYFHLVPASPNPTTIFGISCNRQIRADELLVKDSDVTRSTVQKAVVVLATKPFFGPIRDKLGVVTRALFDQRDFRDMSILSDFKASLESSLRSQLTESALYMGTNIRELVYKFRTRTLLLLKTLMLQKRIMFFGHPVERLCTYQYSLISLIPGLLLNLDDAGSPPLAFRAGNLRSASSLKTSDRKSMLAYQGLPLDIFGKDAFFQPYLPLQQVEMLKDTKSWVCGATNSVVTQQGGIDLLINIETNTFEFKNPKLEKLVALTAADRKWMDDVIKDVNEAMDVGSLDRDRKATLHFKGSEDYLRSKFEEYISAALASVKYSDFLAKGSKSDILITGVGGADSNSIEDFNPLWIAEFRKTNAFEVWNQITDPMLFDIVEARHPCIRKPNVVADLSLRLQEGLQELHLDEQLAPTREALSRTFAQGSTSFMKAMDGVRERWAQRSASGALPSIPATDSTTGSSTPVEISKSDLDSSTSSVGRSRSSSQISFFRSSTFLSSQPSNPNASTTEGNRSPSPNPPSHSSLKPLKMGATAPQAAPETPTKPIAERMSTWGASFGSFISQRAARLSSSSDVPTTSGDEANKLSSSPQPLQTQPQANARSASPPPKSPVPLSREGVTSLLSSWSFGRASTSGAITPSKSPSPAPAGQPAFVPSTSTKAEQPAPSEVPADFAPKDLGEFADAASPVSSLRSSQQSDDVIGTGMAL